MELIFYTAPMSSATPVATVLAELQVPHEKVQLDLSKNDQKKPEFLRLNPHGKVPTLVVDGTPMFEAVAIMQWLGDRFGVERELWPSFEDPARLQALSWTTWSYVEYVQTVVRFNGSAHERVPAELRNEGQAKQAKELLDTHLGILDTQLAKHGQLLGAHYSVADLIVANVVAYGELCGVPVDGHEHVKKWLAACKSRPAFQSAWG